LIPSKRNGDENPNKPTRRNKLDKVCDAQNSLFFICYIIISKFYFILTHRPTFVGCDNIVEKEAAVLMTSAYFLASVRNVFSFSRYCTQNTKNLKYKSTRLKKMKTFFFGPLSL
jgi:hypothetical protein